MSNRTYSTAEVAKLLCVSKRTLLRWLYDGLLPEPKQVKVGRLTARIWTEADIDRARKAKRQRCEEYGLTRQLAEDWEQKAPRLNDKLLHSPEAQALKKLLTKAQKGINVTNLDEAALIAAPGLLLTKEELAARLKVQPSWVYEQTRSRAGVRKSDPLPHVKMGKELRFSWPDVVGWLARQEKYGPSRKTQ